MKSGFLAVLFLLGLVNAQARAWQPTPGHLQMPLWPGAVPDARPVRGPEETRVVTAPLVAGMPWLEVSHVSRPTLTVYPAKGRNTGAAIIVSPGGGYEILAIDLEGTEVCRWFSAHGITAVLLKYRVPAPRSYPNFGAYPESPIALEDAQRALGLVRYHAAEWHIDPHKVGVVGFSAGGHLVAAISTHFARRLYRAVDAADRQSCRPDFAIAVYPGHLSLGTKRTELNPAIPVTRRTPPTFIVQAENDPVDDVQNSLVYFAALKKAGVPVEMHLYAQGGHAFGLRPTQYPITRWPNLVETWLRTIGMVSAPATQGSAP